MIEKKLVKMGNTLGLIIDKTFLKIAGLDTNTKFSIKVESGQITIKSIKDEEKHEKTTKE